MSNCAIYLEKKKKLCIGDISLHASDTEPWWLISHSLNLCKPNWSCWYLVIWNQYLQLKVDGGRWIKDIRIKLNNISVLLLQIALGLVAELSKVLTAVPLPFMVWSTLALSTYHLWFVSWVFHVIFSFVHFISLYTLGGLRAFRKPLPYNYVFIQSSDCKSYINNKI